jgi:hypothetical protein
MVKLFVLSRKITSFVRFSLIFLKNWPNEPFGLMSYSVFCTNSTGSATHERLTDFLLFQKISHHYSSFFGHFVINNKFYIMNNSKLPFLDTQKPICYH